MNEIKIFNSPQFGEIRTAGTSEQPLFCLADVCRAVGIKNNRNVRNRLDEEDVHFVDTLTEGGAQSMVFVTESGMYAVIMRSNNETTKPFRKWVTSEVLPSIRKTGGYMVVKDGESEADIMARAVLIAQSTIERQQKQLEEANVMMEEQRTTILEQSSEIEALKLNQSYLDTVLRCKDTVKITVIAQDYGMSAVRFNRLLHEYGIQRFVGDQWVLYAKYLGDGYVHSSVFDYQKKDGTMGARTYTTWTQKGRMFLYNVLKEHGVLPLIEREAV